MIGLLRFFRTWSFLSLVLLSIVFHPACSSIKKAPPEKSMNTENLNSPKPVLHYIGEQAVISFKTGKDMVIPIVGKDLYAQSVHWEVDVTGTSPLIENTDFELITMQEHGVNADTGLNRASVKIKQDYLKNVKSGDYLTISIRVFGKEAKENVIEPIQRIKHFEELLKELTSIRQMTASYTSNEMPINTRLDLNHSFWQVYSGLPTSLPDSVKDKLKNVSDGLADPAYNDRQLNKYLEEAIEAIPREIDRIKTTHMGSFTTSSHSFATRRFLLYTVEDYRKKFLETHVGADEIKAFPVPSAQVKDIFGPLVDDHYFVVAISFSNRSKADRLINTGMINAYGRALVKSKKSDPSLFMVPVEVAPLSPELVYTLIADQKKYRAREWIFRGLEFAGSLGTTIATGFGGSDDVVRAFAIFTGDGLPAGKTLWPDDVPGYLRNIVNYSMPELVKIPKGAATSPKVLFFSKKKLSLLISDSSLFCFKDGEAVGPDSSVAYLSFDTLDIPFQHIIEASTSSDPDKL